MITFRFDKNQLILPVAFLIAYLVNSIDFLRIISYLLTTIPLHEMGHALMAWMGGRWALPLGAIIPTAGMTLIANFRSPFFIFIFFSLLTAAIYYFYNKKYKFHFSVLVLIFVISLYLTFKVDEAQLAMFISFAGILGEIVLSAFLIICFFYDITTRFRWDFWRYPVLLYGTIGFTNTALQWHRIKNHLQEMPMGSAMSAEGARDMSGDLNRILLAGWPPEHIVAVYWAFIKTCMIIITLHYLISLIGEETVKNDKQITD